LRNTALILDAAKSASFIILELILEVDK